MQGTSEAGKDQLDIDLLRKICSDRLAFISSKGQLYADLSVYQARLDREIAVYDKSGYASIILIISDYINWARNNGVVVGPGRGSAAGSLVVFLSQITTIDPIRFDLIFERFLNPERISLPDIDTDFSDRDLVIEYLRSKYGQNRVAKVGVPSLFKPRSALDEFARMLGIDFAEAKRITKLVGDAKTFDEAFEISPDLQKFETQYQELFSLSRAIQGYVRQITTHPSAVILTSGPIGAEIPMQRPPGAESKEGYLVTGWDGEELDTLGYVKLDILTVDNLSTIDKSIQLIKERHGVVIDFYDLDLYDKVALEGFENGETVAVFQLEEQKSISILKSLPGITFDEVCAVNALIRPGLDVDQFINARNNHTPEYIIPELKPILSDTYGVILYQEQVMKMCVDLAGFSMAKADKVRKIIAKTSNQKSDKGLIEIFNEFKEGYLAKGLNPDKFDALWEKILACQNYIFNKSHGTAYGYIAYADMFLKRHYPIEFMCAALQTRSREIFVKECNRLDIRIIPPCVNKSSENYSIDDRSIMVGLSSIKHVGAKAKAIIERRPYSDEFDFFDRAKPNKKQIESLCFSGALDCFLEKGSSLKMNDRVDLIKRFCKEGMSSTVTMAELSNGEKEAIGFYILCNPLGDFDEELSICTTPGSLNQPQSTLVGGMVSRIHEHQCKTGFMAFVSLLTIDGEMDTILWPSTWAIEKKSVKVGNIIRGIGRKTDRGNYAISNVKVLRES